MSRYRFQPDVARPERMNLYDTSGALVMWLPAEPAMVVSLMYQNMVRTRGLPTANELMFGYTLGITHAILYRDQFPRAEVTRDGPSIHLRMIDPDGSEVMPLTDIRDVPDGARQGGEIFGRIVPDGKADQ